MGWHTTLFHWKAIIEKTVGYNVMPPNPSITALFVSVNTCIEQRGGKRGGSGWRGDNTHYNTRHTAKWFTVQNRGQSTKQRSGVYISTSISNIYLGSHVEYDFTAIIARTAERSSIWGDELGSLELLIGDTLIVKMFNLYI